MPYIFVPMKFVQKIWPILYNKFFIATAVFLIYVLIFDSNNLSTQIRLSRELKKLKAEKQFYLDEIKKDRAAVEVLMTDQQNLERFAREKYLMKRDDEDVYLIIRKDKKK